MWYFIYFVKDSILIQILIYKFFFSYIDEAALLTTQHGVDFLIAKLELEIVLTFLFLKLYFSAAMSLNIDIVMENW